jgi:uncharacterized repeat protein (TIGR03803 family)
MKTVLRFFALVLLTSTCAPAQSQYKALYSFSGTDGSAPSSLILGRSGNFYGLTQSGGTGTASNCPYGCGTVFSLSSSDGNWTLTTLYQFCSVASCLDGNTPTSALVSDSNGNLYGATQFGGSKNKGTIFELSRSAGKWTETVLYNFCSVGENCPDGEEPSGAIALDAQGNLYGATVAGGSGCSFYVTPGCGAAFELLPPSSPGAAWTERVIYNLCATAEGTQCPDGYSPLGGLTLGKSGNLFGTASYGGLYSSQCFQGCGTVFMLHPQATGWSSKMLYAPASPIGGEFPVAPLSANSAGGVYGSFAQGGEVGAGVLFQLSATGKGSEYSLLPGNDDNPTAAVIAGDGVLYGSAYGSQVDADYGSVFQVTPKAKEAILHTFCSEALCADGSGPLALVQDKAGNIYGVTTSGGNNTCTGNAGCGVVFEIKP